MALTILLQLHIVHIREDVLNLADAKNFTDGIAVLAFFVKVGGQFLILSLKSNGKLAVYHGVKVALFQDLNLPKSYRHAMPECGSFIFFYILFAAVTLVNLDYLIHNSFKITTC